ncbi:MAG TPA: ChbG/HpnK family deacetylase, partial [Gemmatimonadales bacterium]
PTPADTTPLEERLGYPRGSRLLILHFDDLGVAGPEDQSAWAARDSGLVVSASVIVPGPKLQEVAAYTRAHPDFDLGIHLALTSEWSGYRWGPIAPPESVPTLLDADGWLRRGWDDTTTIRWQDVERELHAQIAAARAVGIRPTHLDVHEYVLFSRGPVLFEILRRVAQSEGLPFLSASEWVAGHTIDRRFPRGPLVLARVFAVAPDVPPDGWTAYYEEQIRALPPGVSELIVHPAADSLGMKALTGTRVNWGAAWRARDWAFVASPGFRRLLADEHIHLVTWRQIDSALVKERP